MGGILTLTGGLVVFAIPKASGFNSSMIGSGATGDTCTGILAAAVGATVVAVTAAA
jgi:hypothetical protein